jgi:hypothetical protein
MKALANVALNPIGKEGESFVLPLWNVSEVERRVRGCEEQEVKRCIMCSGPIGGTFLRGGGGWKSYSSTVGGSLSGMIPSTSSSGHSSNWKDISVSSYIE